MHLYLVKMKVHQAEALLSRIHQPLLLVFLKKISFSEKKNPSKGNRIIQNLRKKLDQCTRSVF